MRKLGNSRIEERVRPERFMWSPSPEQSDTTCVFIFMKCIVNFPTILYLTLSVLLLHFHSRLKLRVKKLRKSI
jgi:hypothetical protein